MDVLSTKLDVTAINYLQDMETSIIWEAPEPNIDGFTSEIIENYQISRGFKFGFIYENGSESYGLNIHPNIYFDHESKEWSYSAGGALRLIVRWKNPNYTIAILTISLIVFTLSIVVAFRTVKKSRLANEAL